MTAQRTFRAYLDLLIQFDKLPRPLEDCEVKRTRLARQIRA